MTLSQKIFSVKNDEFKKHKIITIFGIKIKFKNNFNFEYRKEQYYKKHEHYINRKAKTKIRRLFITTGNYNLLNTLTLINQLGTGNFEDILIIISHAKKQDFTRCNYLMARIHSFKKIIFLDGSYYEHRYKYFILNNLFNFDEVYCANIGSAPQIAAIFYPFSKKYLVDEGIGGILAKPNIKYNKFEKMYIHKYSDKIDYYGFSKDFADKFEYINKDIFNNVTKKIQNLFPLEINPLKEDKTILICGTCGVFINLDENSYTDYLKKIIEKLHNYGYSIIYKPHPREVLDFSKLGVPIFKTPIPIEVYNLENIVAVISFCSFSATHMFYLKNTLGFQFNDLNYEILKFEETDKLQKKFLLEYTPPIDIVYFDCHNLSFEQLKKEIFDKTSKYLMNLSLLSSNKNFSNNGVR